MFGVGFCPGFEGAPGGILGGIRWGSWGDPRHFGGILRFLFVSGLGFGGIFVRPPTPYYNIKEV